MLIKSDDLARHLASAKTSGSLAPLWVIVGEEALLALEAGDALRACAKELGYTERCVLAFGATSDWSPLMDALMSVSLFDDKKIIELRFLSAGPGIKGGKVLSEFAQMAPTAEGIVSIVHLTQVDYTTKKAAWYKTLTANANVVSCEPISRTAYPRWIQNRL
ncbi:MAG: DNA polymerase III subunit delta, partial [Burkholderiaceae bacterium]|nr:DNA polymerase III subunit delta [Burkholderiaceae bacterium]